MAPKNIIFKILKYGAIFVLALFVFYLAGEAGLQIKYRLEAWKNSRAGEQLNNAIIELMKKDTYGGKTPEETYNMFVDALKKQDIDLAVRYFVLDPDRRIRYRQEFIDKQQKGELEKYANAFPKWEEFDQVKDNYNDWITQAEVWNSTTIDKPMMVYDDVLKKEIEIPPGKYVQYDIIFIKNINNLWKISSL